MGDTSSARREGAELELRSMSANSYDGRLTPTHTCPHDEATAAVTVAASDEEAGMTDSSHSPRLTPCHASNGRV